MKKASTFLLGIIILSFYIGSAYTTYGNQPQNFGNSVSLQTDTLAPVVMDFHIEFSEELNDSVSAVFTITYSEDVQLVENFSIVSHSYVNDGWVDFGRYDDTEVSVEGNVITITPSHNFFSLERYELVISAGSVEDLSGNPAESFTRVFIANTDAPEVTHYDIELTYNQMMDSVSAVFKVHYSENVHLGGTFQIVTHIIYSNGDWDVYDRYGSSEVTVTNNLITVVPVRMFSAAARYEFVITFGSVQDLAGNFAPSFTRVFVTDTTSPEVTDFETEFIPTASPDSTNARFTLTYNEDVVLSPVYKFITYHRNIGVWEEYEVLTDTNIVVSGKTVTIQPSRSFLLTDSYEFVITAGSVRDLVGNLAGSFTNVFLLDRVSPTLLSVDPDIGELIELDATFTFTFDENVRLSENFGFYTYYWDIDSARYIQIERLKASQVTVEGDVVTFSPSVAFWSNHPFQVTLTSGSVRDFEGNPFIYISGNDTTTYFSERFWTVDSDVTIINFMPKDGDIINYIPENLTISFSGNIMLLDSSAVEAESLDSLIYLRQDGTELTHKATINATTNLITITPSEELEVGATYTYGFLSGFINAAGDTIPSREATFTIQDTDTAIQDYTIAEIQGKSDISPLVGETVRITGTVTGVVVNGFFVQDDNAAWSGIWVEYAGDSFPEAGDGVTVIGVVNETNELTTITATEVTVMDESFTVEPVILDSFADALNEMYESVLVQITGARAGTVNLDGEWAVYSETEDSLLVGNLLYVYSPIETHFYNLTGIITARTGVYRLEPRMEADIIDVTDITNVNLASAITFDVYPNPFSNYINISNSDKLSRIIVANIAGQRVIDIKSPGRELNTSHLVSGVYLINMHTKDGSVKTKRIVKR